MRMTFKQWLTNRYETISGNYRMNLQAIVSTCQQWAEGEIWESKHTQAALQVMQSVPIEPLGKYPGEVTEEEKEWYKTCHKPNYQWILSQYEKELTKLEHTCSK